MPEFSLNTMAVVTGAILALYLGGIAYAILAPQKQHDPQRGVAVGCLMLATIPAIVAAILVGIGVAFDLPRLVRWPFVVCVVVFGYVAVMLAAQLVVRVYRGRRQ